MYGYLRTYSDELKVKQVRLYKKYYCTLCSQLDNKIGILYRFLTSYDITLFLMIFDCLSEDKKECKVKCPTKRKSYMFSASENALNYSLIVCLYWVREKLIDDYNDEKRHRLLRRIFSRNKKIKNILKAEQPFSWDKSMEQYYRAEQDEKSSFDELIKAIGNCYGGVFRDYVTFTNISVDMELMYNFGKNIGEYIYIMDAYDDYFDDKKKKRFNPFYRMIGYTTFEDDCTEISKRVEFILEIICANLQQIIHEIFSKNSDQVQIIKNVLSFGIWRKYKEISKKYKLNNEK